MSESSTKSFPDLNYSLCGFQLFGIMSHYSFHFTPLIVRLSPLQKRALRLCSNFSPATMPASSNNIVCDALPKCTFHVDVFFMDWNKFFLSISRRDTRKRKNCILNQPMPALQAEWWMSRNKFLLKSSRGKLQLRPRKHENIFLEMLQNMENN